MKKYNLSEIMKRAWALVKQAGVTISSGLKKAWKEAKGMKELKGTEKQVKWAQDIIHDAYANIDSWIRTDKKAMEKLGCENPEEWEGSFFMTEITVFTELRKMLDDCLEGVDSAAAIIERRSMFDPSRIREIARVEVNKRRNAR